MAAWYSGSASVLLIVATTALYVTVAVSLDSEGDQLLGYSVEYLKKHRLRKEFPQSEEDWPESDYRIRDATGRAIAASPTADERLPPRLIPGAAGVNYRTSSGRWVRAIARQSDGILYEVSYDRTRELELLSLYRNSMVFVLVPALAASTLVGIMIARRGLRPVAEIAAMANRIGPERLGDRIVTEGLPSELADLARTFNFMLGRLQDSFGRLERFSGDIAHELRTPVHAIRNVAEVALTTSDTREEDREALANCLESAEHLTRLIERLLFLARADDPTAVLELETIEMAGELTAIREFYAPSAEEAGVELTTDAPPRLTCRLDRTLFQRALGNLITNALAHTPGGGRVTVSASSGPGGLTVLVSDTGRGIAPEHQSRLFDRFYRPDSARSPGQGVGLGLAIVKSIVELHGGSVSLASRPGAGSTVTLIFPSALDDEIVIDA